MTIKSYDIMFVFSKKAPTSYNTIFTHRTVGLDLKSKERGLLIKFISEDTLNHISLHDCVIEEVSTAGQNLLVIFEHIDVKSDHPLNDTGKAMYTGKALFTFVDIEILDSILYDTSGIRGKRRVVVEEDSQKIELDITELLVDFEVLRNDEIRIEDSYYIHRFDGLTSLKYNADFGYWIIKYKKLIIEWEEFIDTAWFEKR